MKGELGSWEKIFVILGISLIFAGFLTFFIAFVTAYSFPSKSVLITINDFNEADPELILASISLLMGLWAIGTLIKKL
jgi:hypothetical protein